MANSNIITDCAVHPFVYSDKEMEKCKAAVVSQTNRLPITSVGSVYSNIVASSHTVSDVLDYKNMVRLMDNSEYEFEDGVTVSGKEIKTCFKFLLEMAKKEIPEEFI
jgi:hypothetical protein